MNVVLESIKIIELLQMRIAITKLFQFEMYRYIG